MPLIAAAPPQPVAGSGGFDYVIVDAADRRVYAAHEGNASLLIVDADSGKVLGQVKVGPMHGSAVDPKTGNVFTGDGDAHALSEVDPRTMRELRRVAVAGPVDAIAYDPLYGRIYGDEDDGTRIFVIDAKTFKQIATINLPGHKPEYLVVDPKTHQLYQNIANTSEIVVIDPKTLKIVRTIPTPEITNNHPLQYDAEYDQLLVGGENNKLSAYSSAGKHLYTVDFPTRVDQCTLDQSRHLMACAGGGQITLVQTHAGAAPAIVGHIAVSGGVHTVGIDAKTGDIWAVWGGPNGGFVQRFTFTP